MSDRTEHDKGHPGNDAHQAGWNPEKEAEYQKDRQVKNALYDAKEFANAVRDDTVSDEQAEDHLSNRHHQGHLKEDVRRELRQYADTPTLGETDQAHYGELLAESKDGAIKWMRWAGVQPMARYKAADELTKAETRMTEAKTAHVTENAAAEGNPDIRQEWNHLNWTLKPELDPKAVEKLQETALKEAESFVNQHWTSVTQQKAEKLLLNERDTHLEPGISERLNELNNRKSMTAAEVTEFGKLLTQSTESDTSYIRKLEGDVPEEVTEAISYIKRTASHMEWRKGAENNTLAEAPDPRAVNFVQDLIDRNGVNAQRTTDFLSGRSTESPLSDNEDQTALRYVNPNGRNRDWEHQAYRQIADIAADRAMTEARRAGVDVDAHPEVEKYLHKAATDAADIEVPRWKNRTSRDAEKLLGLLPTGVALKGSENYGEN